MRPSHPRGALIALTTLIIIFTLPFLTTAHYTLVDDYTGNNFYTKMDFFTQPDPTNGFVLYQDLDQSIKSNLAGYLDPLPIPGVMAQAASLSSSANAAANGTASSSSNANANGTKTPNIFLGVDYTTPNPKLRQSTRVVSKKSYNLGLLIVDIAHMPTSICGIWPALWMVGPSWPTNGEIDILEGVNLAEVNAVTLHTGAGCSIDDPPSGTGTGTGGAMLGKIKTRNCDVNAMDQDKNVGCSIEMPKGEVNGGATFGKGFNDQGGAVLVMEWKGDGIKSWNFPYGGGGSGSKTVKFPDSLLNAKVAPDPSTFGTPVAVFSGKGCDFGTTFKDQNIVINTAMCGDWAGKEWEKAGCDKRTGKKTCEEYVAGSPGDFTEAYWEIRSLRYFQEDVSTSSFNDDDEGEKGDTPGDDDEVANLSTPVNVANEKMPVMTVVKSPKATETMLKVQSIEREGQTYNVVQKKYILIKNVGSKSVVAPSLSLFALAIGVFGSISVAM